jgi:hypothetical protein
MHKHMKCTPPSEFEVPAFIYLRARASDQRTDKGALAIMVPKFLTQRPRHVGSSIQFHDSSPPRKAQ